MNANESDGLERAEFIQFAINNLERRIGLMDNKANVMLVLVTATVVAVGSTFLLTDLTGRSPAVVVITGYVVAVAYVWAALLAIWCIRILRPSWKLGKPPSTAMWLTPEQHPAIDKASYQALMGSETNCPPDTWLDAMAATHMNLLSMTSKKMFRYHRTVVMLTAYIFYLAVVGIVLLVVQATA